MLLFSFFFFPFQINAVRSIVPNKSNNEIVMVLQQFDNNVDKAVQAFVDGEYSVPFSLGQQVFNCLLTSSLSPVAHNILCSAEIQVTVILGKFIFFITDPPVCIFTSSRYGFDMAVDLFYLTLLFFAAILVADLL